MVVLDLSLDPLLSSHSYTQLIPCLDLGDP